MMNEFYKSQIHNIDVDIEDKENEIMKYQDEIEHTLFAIECKREHIKQLKQFKADIENKLL